MLETFCQHPYTEGLDTINLFDVLLKYNEKYETMYNNQEITLEQFRNFRLIHTLADFNRNIDENVANDFNSLHKTISKSYMKPDLSVIELLNELKSLYLLGIVTNGTASWQHDKIDAMGIRELFIPDSIIISEEIGIEKPDPQIYLKALSNLKIDATETLFVGDSWINDVVGPAGVGIGAIWLNKKAEKVVETSNLLGVIKSLKELKQLL